MVDCSSLRLGLSPGPWSLRKCRAWHRQLQVDSECLRASLVVSVGRRASLLLRETEKIASKL